jgi:hypothetical protein
MTVCQITNMIFQIWDQGNTRFGVVPKIEKTQNLTPPTTSS